MKKTRPIIPRNAREKVVKRHTSGLKHVALYHLNRKLVGHRSWDDEGNISIEYAIRNNKQHGPFRDYHSNGVVCWATRFVDGKEHGISRQYDWDGSVIGSYRMRHGTGVDLWYRSRGELSEERYVRDGKWNGYERWWWSHHRVSDETHFKDNLEHGIKRSWNSRGRLCRGYPQYFINGLKVTKRTYVRASKLDASLPVYRKEEDNPRRTPPTFANAS
jgi:antitoxin component YwqK of YwqJK toxin-antitoxin module